MTFSVYHSQPRSRRSFRAPTRRGRVLLESCVALMVLTTAGTLLLLAASTSAHLVDTVRMQAVAAQYTTAALAEAARHGCRGVTGSSVAVSRLRVRAAPSGDGLATGVFVSSVWRRAPLAGGPSGRTHRDSTSTKVWCEQ